MLKPISPRGKIINFRTYSEEALRSMKSSLGIYMSVSDLEFIKKHYTSKASPELTTDELFLLDRIIESSRSLAANTAVNELLTSSADIISTYNDMISKYTLKRGSLGKPLSIKDAASVASEYMERIGLAPSRDCECGDTEKERSKVEPETAIAILLPNTDPVEAESAVTDLLSSECGKNILAVRKISEYGIAHALSSLSMGIYTDVTVIRDYTEELGIEFLLSGSIGKYLIAFNKQHLDELTSAAALRSFTLTYFAKSTAGDCLIQKEYPEISLNLPTALIEEISSSLTAASFDLTNTEKDEKIYNSAMLSVTDALTDAIAQGYSREDVTLFNRYILPKNATPEGLGESLAAILGVYRATVELCVAEDHSVEFAETETVVLSSTAKRSEAALPISDTVTESGTKLYLLSYTQDERGLPEYKSLRAMWSYLEKLFKSCDVRYSRRVDGNVGKELELMKGDLSLSLTDDGEELYSRKLKGIIVGANVDIKHGILLGISESKETQTSEVDNIP
ncbi:MAG: hypothetical protein E7641_01320 [Ruminococcaceae bacterium]|nr:hypothetical protein [Oscillospiraceae bacterium]